ncbi:hypothetical protein [Frigoribacterium sp. CG_9.8]|uniref:hypothetical protein n=1 Tax=Frigoribacterium sp. CG_9.8 TaxID=2787733 RepID=UPI0018C99EC7|nr:hypothetical protein [Frigoribacterium sp. CG_9.8]MBG6106569.1 hypothetical protein [Frigoribacterium sp. CG_9.8]
MTDKLPARILLQIREGVMNNLADFELETRGTPIPNQGGTVDHDTNTLSIISGLAEAQRKLVLKVREQAPEYAAEVDAWVRELADWVVSE